MTASETRSGATFLRRGRLAFLLVLLCAPAFASEEPDLDSITGKELQAHVRTLSHSSFSGRSSGTAGCDMAARYLQKEFKSLKLPGPAKEGTSHLQAFPITLKLERGPRCAMVLFSRGPARTFAVEKEFGPFSFSARGTAKRKIVFTGYGITAPEYEWDDYAGVDAKGKIVLCLRREPCENEEGAFFAGKEATTHSHFLTKVLNAQDHGAKGIVIVNAPLATPPGQDRVPPLRGPSDDRVKIPAVFATLAVAEAILAGTGETLQGFQDRLDKGRAPCSTDVPAKMLGLTVDIERREVPTYNVVAYLEGSDPELKGELVIVGAHYDHIGTGEYGSRLGARGRGRVHPGADDNASGTAGVLEIAQAFGLREAKPRRSLLFIGFSGEERGLLGAGHYVREPLFPLDKTVAMLNLDMISRGPEGVAGVSFTGTWERWPAILKAAGERLGLSVRGSASGSGASDHAPFFQSKIPCLFFAAGLHEDYHTPEDTWTKANPVTMEGITKLAYLTAVAVVEASERPVFSEPRAENQDLPYLGIVPGKEVKDLGLTIQDVSPDTPAAKGGIRKGDILAEFDGRPVRTFQDLKDVLALKKAGDKVSVQVFRGGEEVDLEVTLAKRP